MKPVPFRLRVDGQTHRNLYEWSAAVGAVYLLRRRETDVYKFGASVNPYSRIGQLISQDRNNGQDLVYVWSIATNAIGRLERYWKSQWSRYLIDHRREWVSLPAEQVRLFCATSKIIWSDMPDPNPIWIECVMGPYKLRAPRASRPKFKAK